MLGKKEMGEGEKERKKTRLNLEKKKGITHPPHTCAAAAAGEGVSSHLISPPISYFGARLDFKVESFAAPSLCVSLFDVVVVVLHRYRR